MKTFNSIITTILYCWMAIGPIFSQTETSWMKHEKRMILDKVMNIEFFTPTGFIGDSLAVCLDWDNSEVNMLSSDSSFMVSYSIHNPLTQEIIDTWDITTEPKDQYLDREHIIRVEGIVNISYGKDADWRENVHYCSDDIKNKFNADTVISIQIAPKLHEDYNFPDNYNKRFFYGAVNEKYNTSFSHGTVLIIQKKGRGFITLYCFYNDKAKNNLNAYTEAIEGTIRYRNGEPELKKYYDGDEELVLVCIGLLRQKKPKFVCQ